MAPPKKRPSTDQLLRRWEADKKSRIFLQLAEEYRRQDFVDAAHDVTARAGMTLVAFVNQSPLVVD